MAHTAAQKRRTTHSVPKNDTAASRFLLALYSRTCSGWWSLEPFVECFRQGGWDGLQRCLHESSWSIWRFSSRILEFSERRQSSLRRESEELIALLKEERGGESEFCARTKNDESLALSFLDENYPQALRTIDDPPPVLWCSRWISPQAWRNCTAVVGSRRSSTYGEKATEFFVTDLVKKYGSTIVSGCAVGIDSAAHHACLEAGGTTIGILGVELNAAPSRVKRLFSHPNAILLSEWPPGFGGQDWNFARRNRLISGLSHGVLVVEAQEKSGTMLTVSSALNQGREVYVVPHSIWSKNGAGVTKLANAGATVVRSAADIFRDRSGGAENGESELGPESCTDTNEEAQLLEILKNADGEMALADLTLARPATISSSRWWETLHALQQKGRVSTVQGVVCVQ